jgi:hypothetical protein
MQAFSPYGRIHETKSISVRVQWSLIGMAVSKIKTGREQYIYALEWHVERLLLVREVRREAKRNAALSE